MENQSSKSELNLEHLKIIDHGKAFKRRRIGFASALAEGRPLPPDTPIEGGVYAIQAKAHTTASASYNYVSL
jgi:hypothetical protein